MTRTESRQDCDKVGGDPSASSPGRFVAAASGEGGGRPPIWIMRQAGRYLPEYQEIRARHSFVEMCSQPDLAFEVSMQPFERFAMDAVIVFYDILFLAEAMGAPLEYSDRGPVFLEPLRSLDRVRSLNTPDPGGHTAPVLETLSRLRAALPREVAVLGFAGAPFTMAAYLVEGDFRRSGDRIKRMMFEEPATLRELLDTLTGATAAYLTAQVEAGAEAVQLFDTWAGLLSPQEYDDFCVPYQRRIFEAVAATGAPTILYVNGCAHLIDPMASSGADILSLDWRVQLADARRHLGPGVGLQGNLDPSTLFGSPEEVRERTVALLESMRGDSHHVFNLGHGILPETPVASVEAVVDAVKSFE